MIKGSISSHTMRPQDLIPAFIYVLECLEKYFECDEHSDVVQEGKQIIKESESNPDIWETEDTMIFLNEELWQALTDHAPEGYYFGPNPGDGSDYGFWETDCVDKMEVVG